MGPSTPVYYTNYVVRSGPPVCTQIQACIHKVRHLLGAFLWNLQGPFDVSQADCAAMHGGVAI